jgi:hypothetical protein
MDKEILKEFNEELKELLNKYDLVLNIEHNITVVPKTVAKKIPDSEIKGE